MVENQVFGRAEGGVISDAAVILGVVRIDEICRKQYSVCRRDFCRGKRG